MGYLTGHIHILLNSLLKQEPTRAAQSYSTLLILALEFKKSGRRWGKEEERKGILSERTPSRREGRHSGSVLSVRRCRAHVGSPQEREKGLRHLGLPRRRRRLRTIMPPLPSNHHTAVATSAIVGKGHVIFLRVHNGSGLIPRLGRRCFYPGQNKNPIPAGVGLNERGRNRFWLTKSCW